MPTCDLCRHEPAVDRFAGVGLCRGCRDGHGVARHLRGHGVDLAERRWRERTTVNDRTVITDYLELTATLPVHVDAAAHLADFATSDHQPPPAPEGAGPWRRLVHWLTVEDIEVGDPLFDHAVVISEPEGEALQALLRDEGVQSAVMELVSQGGVRIAPGWLRLRRASVSGVPMVHTHGPPLAALAVHLCRVAEQGAG